MTPYGCGRSIRNLRPKRMLTTSIRRIVVARWQPIALLLILLSFGMRAYRLGDVPIWGDEGFTFTLASRGYPELAEKILEMGEPQPVGSYFLQKAWLDLGGRTEFNLRMLNVAFGVLAVALAWAVARHLTGSRLAAFAAALLIATNPFGIDHSREYRSYAMAACLCLASIAALLAFARAPTWRTVAAVVLTEWWAIQAHYVAAFFVAALGIAGLVWWALARAAPPRIAWRPAPSPGRWILAQFAVAALTLPWLALARGTASTYGGTGRGQVSLWTIAGEELALFTSADLVSEIGPVLLIAGVVAAVLGAVALWRAQPSRRGQALALSLSIAIPLLGVWAAAMVKPVFHARYLIVIWPSFALLASAGVAARSRVQRSAARAAVLVLALASLAGGFRFLANLNFDNLWRPLISAFEVRSKELPDRFVILTIPWPDPAFWYYYRKENATVLPGPIRTFEGISGQMQGFSDRRIRRVLTHSAIPNWWDTAYLANDFDPAPYTRVDAYVLNGHPIYVFERVFADRLAPLDLRFANGVQVRGVELLTDTQHTALGLELALSGTPRLTGSEKSFLHIVDPSAPNRIVAQVDLPLIEQDLRVPALLRGIPLPDTLRQGVYEIWYGLYDPATPGAPRIRTADGNDRVLLGRVDLGR